MGYLLNLYFVLLLFRVGAGVSTLMAVLGGLDPYIFRQKMEKTHSQRGKKGLERCLFPTRVGFFPMYFLYLEYSSRFVTLLGV